MNVIDVFLFYKNFLFHMFIYLCTGARGQPTEVCSHFPPCGSQDQTEVVRLDSKHFPTEPWGSPKEMFMKSSYLDHFRGHDLFETIDFPWRGEVSMIYIPLVYYQRTGSFSPDLHHKGFLNHEICLTQRKETKNNSSW